MRGFLTSWKVYDSKLDVVGTFRMSFLKTFLTKKITWEKADEKLGKMYDTTIFDKIDFPFYCKSKSIIEETLNVH